MSEPFYGIKPEYRAAFLRFLKTGEADESFIQYMEANEGVRRAIDTEIEAQAEELREFAKALLNIKDKYR